MCGEYPTFQQSIIKMFLVVLGPLLLQFFALLIPLSPPLQGLTHNLVFLFAFVPYITLTAGVGNIGVVGMILGEPTRWLAIPIYCVVAVCGLCLLTFVPSYPPFIGNAAVLAATLRYFTAIAYSLHC